MSVKHTFSQAGDTLVEVMFAVAVVGMVIGGSYVIASRALRTGRYAQEQTEALKQAESQIEKLKYLASLGDPETSATSIFNTTLGDFCVTDTAPFTKVLVSNAAAYTTNCTQKGGDKLYTVLVKYQKTPPVGTDLFTVVVTWDRAGTSVQGHEQLTYRLHNSL